MKIFLNKHQQEEKHSDKEDTSMEFDSLKKLIEEPIKKEPQVQHPIIHQNQNNQHQIQNQHNNQNQLHHQPQHQHQIQHQTPNQQIFKNTQIDNNVNQPIIFSKSTQSHPLEIFFVILIAGLLSGVTGMIVAVPLYTILKVIAKEFFSTNKLVYLITKKI